MLQQQTSHTLQSPQTSHLSTDIPSVEDIYLAIHVKLGETDTVDDVLSGHADYANAPTEQQLYSARAINDHQQVLIKGGNKVGKTHSIPYLLLSCLYQEVGNVVLVTSNNEDQLMTQIWSDLRHLIYRLEGAERFAYYKKRGWFTNEGFWPDKDNHPYWYIHNFSTGNKQETRVGGFHSKTGRTYIFVDEASGVPMAFWKGKEGLLFHNDARIVALGNPLYPYGGFFAAYDSGDWFDVTYDQTKHPNYIHKRQIYKSAISYEMVDLRLRRWGRDSPQAQARIFGNFPDNYGKAVIPRAWFEAALDRFVLGDGIDVAGADVAGGAEKDDGDNSIYFTMRDRKIKYGNSFLGIRMIDFAEELLNIDGIDRYCVDTVGIGGGIIAHLQAGGQTASHFKSNGNSSVTKRREEVLQYMSTEDRRIMKDKYALLEEPSDMLTEAWQYARDLFEETFDNPDDPNVGISIDKESLSNMDVGENTFEQLRYEITSREFDKLDGRGRPTVESKKKWKERLEESDSPDISDAFVITLYAHFLETQILLHNNIKTNTRKKLVVY